MEAILSKEGGGYDLYRIDEDGKRVTFASTQDYKQKLSLKNCQAIERGYDLDELAYSSFPNGTYETSEIDLGLDMYKLGFQKALELMGDKKFSEEDIKQTLYLKTGFDKDGFSFYKSDEEIIQSLQQTEWNCIVEMEEVDVQFDRSATSLTDYDHFTVTRKPKLDADGCLILKRK